MTLPKVNGLRADVWAKTPDYMRLDALQDMENQLAAQEKRPALPVKEIPSGKREIGSDGQPLLRGYFDPADGKNGSIFIDPQLIHNDEPYQATETYFHEARHAYQHDAANHPENHPEVSGEQAEQWKVNEKGYIGKEDIELGECQYGHYYGQPNEVDARQVGQERTEELYANQFQDQAGYPAYREAADEVREATEQKVVDELGADYQQQAWQAVQNKYEASQEMQNKAVGKQEQEPEIEAGTGTAQTLEDGAETAESAAETAVPEYGATKETAEAAKTAANETAEASGQSFEAPEGGGRGGEDEEEDYQYGYGL